MCLVQNNRARLFCRVGEFAPGTEDAVTEGEGGVEVGVGESLVAAEDVPGAVEDKVGRSFSLGIQGGDLRPGIIFEAVYEINVKYL